VIATAGHGVRVPSARCHRNHSSPYSAMWAALRRIVSHTPSPVPRSGWAEKKKIAPISASGGTNRKARSIGR
jgi:hypothetical protein